MVQFLGDLDSPEELGVLLLSIIVRDQTVKHQRARGVVIVSFKQSLLAHVCLRILSEDVEEHPVLFILWVLLDQSNDLVLSLLSLVELE